MMLISRVSDDEASSAERKEGGSEEDHSHEFQTANELFDLMAKNHNFQSSGDESLTTRDLVILYKNIDLGTKLMSSANDFKRKTPNQYVETVVYNEDHDSDSDITEIYSSEDLHNVVLVNKERIDLLNNPPSLDNTLCHKFSDFDLQTSDLSIDYDRQCVFKDPYVKEQLKNLNILSSENEYENTVLPVSLLDYICCKRLEDNYNFYMDNIIRYVQHTIDQLKRISNGDFLTERAKEKWKEVEKEVRSNQDPNNTKILAKCTSIPLHVEKKLTGNYTTWDDIVHSEVDVRYLSKILEKKIVVEIPKTISSPYKLFSKCCAGKLVISCKKENRPNVLNAGEEESRVDVVFKLERSEGGKVMSNINSIMVVPKRMIEEESIVNKRKILPLAYEFQDNIYSLNDSENSRGFENDKIDNIRALENEFSDEHIPIEEMNKCSDDSFKLNYDPRYVVHELQTETIVDYEDVTTVPMVDIRDMISRKRTHRPEASFDIIPGDELRMTMQRLSIQSSLPEESLEDMPLKPAHGKKKSPTRNRVKSPYQNNSYVLEEKKRKKLLEIRDRREKRKIAMGENCKVTKSKYAKNAIMPATSNSVTKLSITNKSFYNSIYGSTCNMNAELKQPKVKERKDNKRDPIIIVPLENSLTEEDPSKNDTSTTTSKYLDRNYYLDDTVTEMMYLKMKRNKNERPICDGSFVFTTSINPSTTNIKAKEVSFTTQDNMKRFDEIISEMNQTEHHSLDLITTKSNTLMIVPSNTPKDSIDGTKRSITSGTSIEFRKSIDKIYELMEKLAKTEGNESKPTKSKFTATINDEEKDAAVGTHDGSTAQCSDSGTSVKHHNLSSEPSYISFEKDKTGDDRKEYYCIETAISKSSDSKIHEETPVVVPKVIINNKVHGYNSEKQKSFRRRPMDHSSIQVNDNPLKAISQLLHDIDNVQKTRQKASAESKSPTKRGESPKFDTKNSNVRLNFRNNVKLENKSNAKPKLNQGDHMKNPLLDIVDEYKEARGEAVRGPSKINNSRLNTLAQPKKSYVQAHMEEFQTRYGRNVMSDRLQKLSVVPVPPVSAKPRPTYLKNKQKKFGTETVGLSKSVTKSSSQTPPIEKMIKYRHSGSSNNESMTLPKPHSETPRKHDNLPDKPENLKNKMVAVESYVKHHYGRLPPAGSSTRANLTSRTPLIPDDLEYSPSLGSSINTLEQSSAIGKKLHNIIDTMINTQTELSCVQESNEVNSKASSHLENLTKEDRASIRSDCGECEFDQPSLQGIHQKNLCEDDFTADDVQKVKSQNPVDSETELEKLESALHSKLPAGAFHKRLRIRNFTLTPKHSLQQSVVLHSGDYNASFVVEPELQKVKIKNCKSETIAKLKTLSYACASNTKLNLNINTYIPMQITTVGYAFPSIQRVHTSVMGFLKSEALEATTSIQKQDKPNGMLDNEDHICHSKHQVNFGDFDNISATADNPLASPENSEELHKENSVENGCNDNETDNIVVKEDIKGLDEESIDVISLSNTDKGAEIFMRKPVDSEKSINSDKVGCSSSLDILVCLLNEIQKITTCELHGDGFDSNEQKFIAALNSGAATLRDSVHSQVPDVVSIVSIDKLRHLESKHSIISVYLSNDDGDNNKRGYASNTVTKLSPKDVLRSNKNVYDKEVTVNIQEKELVHAFTDVPSQFLPVTITSGTYMSNSLIGIISEPSTPSFINLKDLQNNILTAHKKIIEIPRHETIDVVQKTQEETIKKASSVETAAVPLKKSNEKTPEKSCINSGKPVKTKVLKVRKKISDANKVKYKYDSYVNGVTVKKSDTLESDEQQVMKMKRDVLVTLYSILVFTVFAALSFPEMMSLQ